MKKRLISVVVALIMVFACAAAPASAKTISSARADNIFFYATGSDGKSVLLKVMPLSELKALAHKNAKGENYSISATDNYPTTQYCEGVGFTVGELLNHVKSVTTVSGADALSFSGSDELQLMATDSYGNYSRSWTYDELYGVKRYYFEGLYDSGTGWNTGWEVAGEDDSKYGITLDEYNSLYKETDTYYADKRAVFESGEETEVVLMTESYSGRTTSETLIASTEPGIASYITANGGTVKGSLSGVLSDDYALRLSLPMTEADLMAAHRTAYDNFKWIYNMRLDMSDAPAALKSLGTVAEPVPSFSLSGNTLTVTFSCATSGATIYYGDDGAPQTEYTGPITIDVTGRDLDSSPVTLYATAVKEGYDDAGVLTFKYPGMAPSFKTVYSSMTGSDLTFSAADGVSSADWSAWTGAINFITMKTPSGTGYETLEKSLYAIDKSAKTITFDKSLFTETGSYSFIFHATKYANKNTSVTMKKAAPAVSAAESYTAGGAVTLTFGDSEYQKSLSVYVVSGTGENASRSMISSSYLDRTQSGQVSIKQEYFSLSSSAITGAGTYTLELSNDNYSPASQTVTVTITGDGSSAAGTGGFTDVAADAWYADAVSYAVENGLFTGTGTSTFSPGTPMTRGMIVTVLWRMAGSPEAAEGVGFDDVQAGAWYADAVAWGAETGVVTGVGNGRFDPDASVTREQLAVMLYRYAEHTGRDVSQKGDISSYDDAAAVSSWAADGIKWAAGQKIINGTSSSALSPQGTATRAQVAQMLMNYLK